MKRSQQAVPAKETGHRAGDYHGMRNHMRMPEKGGRNATTNEAMRGAGVVAPRPRGGAAMLGNDRPAHPSQGGMARVTNARSSPSGRQGTAGSFAPVQTSAYANLRGTGAPVQSGAVAPAPRGGPPGIRAGGRNQNWPNGPMYTDAIKRGSSGRDAGPVATRKSKRMGKGAAFYGEYPS